MAAVIVMGTEGDTIRLAIERMAYGTDAVAHDGTGKTVFVTGAAPGDVVDAVITGEGSTFARAHVVNVVEAGWARTRPACPLAGTCGGCPWAHLTRTAQLDAKRSAVTDALTRIGGIDGSVVEELVDTCVDVGQDMGYRNKVELGFARRQGRAVVGMHAVGDRDVIKADRCPLLDADDPKLVRSVSGAVTYLANAHDLDLVRIGIRSSRRTGDLEVALWTQPGAFPRAQAAKVISDATKGRVTSVVRVLATGPAKARRVTGVERLGGKGFWEERVAAGTMRLSAPSFFQVSTTGAERLVDIVMQALSPTADDEAMDLYAGAGTFTLPLARHAAFVSAVESYRSAVRDLRRNVERADLGNVDVVGGDAKREFPDTDADVIVVDPPRAGLAADVVRLLSEQNARSIAYVSCDPATLARDLGRFADHGAYEPVRVIPVDLFPQTYHVETVVLMSRD